MSKFWQEFFRLQGTQIAGSSVYHPQTDGQTEVVNRILEDYLRCFVSEDQKNWTDLLTWGEYSYNTARHSSIGMSPFEALYGRPPPSILSYTRGSSKVAKVVELLTQRSALQQRLKANIERAQHRMKQKADKHRTEKMFDVGAWVFVKLQPYRQVTIRGRRSPKLSKRYGPLQITARIGQVAYKLAFPAKAKIHDVSHLYS